MGIRISLDGGKTFLDAADGVRIVYDDVLIPGDEHGGELHLNLTHEGVISDLWTARDAPGGQLVGTSCEMVEDVVERLAGPPSSGDEAAQRSSQREGEQAWADAVTQQGWNEESQIVHLEGFIRDRGLFGEFGDYAQRAAAEEGEESHTVVIAIPVPVQDAARAAEIALDFIRAETSKHHDGFVWDEGRGAWIPEDAAGCGGLPAGCVVKFEVEVTAEGRDEARQYALDDLRDLSLGGWNAQVESPAGEVLVPVGALAEQRAVRISGATGGGRSRNELRDALHAFKRCAEDAPEGTYGQAKALNDLIGEVCDSVIHKVRVFGLLADNCDKIFDVESVLYDYVKKSNPDASLFPTAEGFGRSLDGPERDRVIAQAVRDRDFLRQHNQTPPQPEEYDGEQPIERPRGG